MTAPATGAVSGRVSVILPTYNRSAFLRAAFESIASQAWPDIEVVVVDDGSTDDTAARAEELTALVAPTAVRWTRQENQGAYGARNTGLRLATGEYIAFYDSDDVWRSYHLERCAGGLAAHADIDWVYGSSRIVDMASGATLDENCFYQPDGQLKAFARLLGERRGALYVLTDPKVTEQSIEEGLYCGLQSSVIRRRVFDMVGAFDASFRNEAEDQVFATLAAAAGARFAFDTDIHLDYMVHAANSSGSSTTPTLAKHLDLYGALIRGFEALPSRGRLGAGEQAALRRRLAREYFWHYGYAGLWTNGRYEEALAAFRRGFQLSSWDTAMAKTLAVSWLKVRLGLVGSRTTHGEQRSGEIGR